MGLAGDGHRALAAQLPWGSSERRYRRLSDSLQEAIRCGITTVVEPQSGLDDLPLYQRAREDGMLASRLIAALFLPPGGSMDCLEAFEEAMRRYDDDRLRVGPVKLYIDDLIELHTAALFEPYADEPATCGGTFYDPQEFGELVAELDAGRFQVLIHAIGDRGVHVALDALAHARQVNGPRDARHQLVHIELAAAHDLARFAELGVVACMQPRHCAADVGGAEWRAAVGPARWPLAWPVRSLHQAGAMLAFFSDWNVVEMDPLTGIYTALTRQDLAGGEPFVPEQAIDLATAIGAYTTGGAYANFCDHDRGTLVRGKAADLIALSGNLFELPPEQIKDCRVELTMVAGHIHHRLW
jgi:predicted amidohydrolase YtcJ